MTLQNHATKVIIFIIENVLSPEGRCVAYPVGVSIVFTYVLIFGLGKVYDLQSRTTKVTFFSLGNVLSPDGLYA